MMEVRHAAGVVTPLEIKLSMILKQFHHKPIQDPNLLGNHWGATSYAQQKNKKTKIPDSQKDVHRRAKIGAQNPQKHKTVYRDCVT